MNPVDEIVYISKSEVMDPIAGSTLFVMIWIENSTFGGRFWLNWTAIVWVDKIFGFIWPIHVLFTDKVPAELPVSRFWQLLMVNKAIFVLITRQDFGVAVDGKGEKLISK